MSGLLSLFKITTKLPLGNIPAEENEKLGKSMKFFPLVGIVISIILAFFYFCFLFIFPNHDFLLVLSAVGSPVAALTVCLEIIISDRIHLSGLARTFDSIFSYRSKQKMLDMMKDKDQKIGINGMLAVMMIIILKIITISLVPPLIVLYPVLGRLGCVINCAASQGARPTGRGKLFADHTKWSDAIIAIIISCLYVGIMIAFFWFYPLPYFRVGQQVLISVAVKLLLMIVIIIPLLSVIYAKWMKKKIGGITGDTLSSLLELLEVFSSFIIIFIIFS